MSAEDDGKRESEDDLPDPDPPPEADDPPMSKPKSAAAAAKELQRQLTMKKEYTQSEGHGAEARRQGSRSSRASSTQLGNGKKGKKAGNSDT